MNNPQNKSKKSLAEKKQLLLQLLKKSGKTEAFSIAKNSEKIAIIGISGRYPMADNLEEFWENLKSGKDCITEIPEERWSSTEFYNPDRGQKGTSYSKWGGFIKGVEDFDSLFFNISPKEAEMIDPQERLFLETVWHTLEDAAYTRSDLAESSVGIFVGVMWGQYELYGVDKIARRNGFVPNSSYASIANRVSYYFNFHGPSIALDTMCSSSLTSIHLACQSIQTGESDVAIAGGVNVSSHMSKYIQLSQGNFPSSDGRCRSFGKGGDGYVPGEGIGAVFLKPLQRALADGDHVHAVIKATAINHGGKTNGYTVPNPRAQSQLIRSALSKANVAPQSISYIEAHGTGTSLGDPIEISGLMNAYNGMEMENQSCPIGSVKSNIGHLESAAGIAGLTKIILQMRHKQLAPSLHSKSLNPNINFKKMPFKVQQQLEDWPKPITVDHDRTLEHPRIAGISSFGAGGSNAHMIIEEAPERPDEKQEIPREPQLILLSGKDEVRLIELAKNLLDYLTDKNHSDLTNSDLRNIAYTLMVGREALELRLALIVETIEELNETLTTFLNDQPGIKKLFKGELNNDTTPLVFLDDEDGSEMINRWISKGKLSKLAELWIAGGDIDWRRLPQYNECQRISLPLYPFARRRCWVPEALTKQQNDDMAPSSPAAVDSNSERLSAVESVRKILEKTWVESPLSSTSKNQISGQVIILVNEINSELVSKLFENQKHITPIIIKKGSKYSQESPTKFIIDFCDESQGKKVIQTIIGNGIEDVTAVIDISDHYAESSSKRTDVVAKITLLQELIKKQSQNSLSILHITKNLQDFQTSSLSLAGADFAGFIKMLGSEYQKVISKTIDSSSDTADDIRDICLGEFAGDDFHSEICYRHGKRYVPVFNDFKHGINDDRSQQSKATTFDPENVVVITGGTSGIGSEVAKHLVKKGVQKLILMGIRPLPARDEWSTILKNETADATTRNKIQQILELEQAGAAVKYYIGSLIDEDKLKSFFQDIKKNFGKIDGVIHCAGLILANNPAFINKNIKDIEQVFEPKILGLEVLHEIFKEDSLKFFTLFSSVASQIPALASSLSDYAAANTFMDIFANFQRSQGYTYYQSINWSNWQETGIGAVSSRIYNQLGFMGLPTNRALQLFDEIMNLEPGPTLIPCLVNSDSFRSENLLKKQQIQVKQTPGSQPDPGLSTSQRSAKSSTSQVQIWLLELFSRELKIPEDQIHNDKPFSDYGVDSILLAELVSTLEKELHKKIDPSLLLEYPTIKQFGNYLSDQYGDSILTEIEPLSAKPPKQNATENSEIIELQTSSNHPTVQQRVNGNNAIAVIGLACNFPGAKDTSVYWDNLIKGRSTIIEVPKSRWDTEIFYSAKHKTGKSMSKWGGFIDGIEFFDPDYFNIPKDAAIAVDPLERQFLEVSVQTLRHAGYEAKELWNRDIGVFVGSRVSNYAMKLKQPSKNMVVGIGQNFIAAYASHFFNFTGPNMVIDTACSSSLVSIHQACQSIYLGECEMALAGGVDILLDESPYLLLSAGKALSPDGKCHTFDKNANGFVPGEGCGAVLLKPLDKALLDGDFIYSVIDSTAINNDGNTMGVTTPNLQGQKRVIQQALTNGNIDADSISYIEAHGTGTMIGDPIEMKALSQVFQEFTNEHQFCAVGSVKSNFGHLLSAAGIASFIKVVLSLHHRQIPPTLNCVNPNPRFDFSHSPFFPNTKLIDWSRRHDIRRAGISSFGFGGTNAHLVVSELVSSIYENHQPTRSPLSPEIFNRKRFWPSDELEEESSPSSEAKKVVIAPENRAKRLPLLALEEV